jgi:hypothetical protein
MNFHPKELLVDGLHDRCQAVLSFRRADDITRLETVFIRSVSLTLCFGPENVKQSNLSHRSSPRTDNQSVRIIKVFGQSHCSDNQTVCTIKVFG